MALLLTGWLIGVLLVFTCVVTAISIRARDHEMFASGIPLYMPSLMAACTGVLVTVTWIAIVRSPYENWNAARTAPAVAWAKGMPLYYPAGVGPVTNFIHGPVAAIVRLPAALASTPTSAIIIAEVCNAALFYLPVIFLLYSLSESWWQLLIGSVIFAGFSNTEPSLVYSAYKIHADAPAVGFTMLAIAFIQLASHKGRKQRWLLLIVAGAATVLSVGSKQNMAPVVIILPLYVWLRLGWKPCVLLTAAEIAWGVAGFGWAVHAFGYDTLVYNTIIIPSRHPWYLSAFNGFVSAFFMSGYLIGDVAIPAMLLVLACLVQRHSLIWSWHGVRLWLARDPWLLPLIMGLLLIPCSLVGKAKVGGNVNALTPTSYFLVAALASCFVCYKPAIAGTWSGFRSCLVLRASLTVCGYLAIISVNPWPKLIESYTELSTLDQNAQQVAFEYAKQNPDKAYFPWNPLSTLMATGNYYHFEYGVIDLYLANERLTPERLRRGLPRNMQQVIFPPEHQSETMLKLLPEYNVPSRVDDLPGWTVFTRARGSLGS